MNLYANAIDIWASNLFVDAWFCCFCNKQIQISVVLSTSKVKVQGQIIPCLRNRGEHNIIWLSMIYSE